MEYVVYVKCTGVGIKIPAWVSEEIDTNNVDIIHVWIINDNEVHVVTQGKYTDAVYCYTYKREVVSKVTATRVS